MESMHPENGSDSMNNMGEENFWRGNFLGELHHPKTFVDPHLGNQFSTPRWTPPQLGSSASLNLSLSRAVQISSASDCASGSFHGHPSFNTAFIFDSIGPLLFV